jgi:DNA polymerase-4
MSAILLQGGIMESLFPFTASAGCPRWFFADMNAFYASVEQQECAKYRGKPVIVVPVLAAHTCAIAASYEAKKLGIKTGTSVALAQAGCRDLQIVEARPELYLAYHARLVSVLNRHFATIRVLSVDEMACRLPPLLYKTVRDEKALAERVKADVYQEMGEYVRCSVGIGPNVFLAKVASDRQKPDGLTIWNEENLPDALFTLKLTDLPGIGSAMKRRLAEHGLTTVQQLWEATPVDLRRIWHSVVGARWYYMLRGSQEADYQPMQGGNVKKSVGHSNVLAPEHRTLDGAKRILLELFSKALKRLRAYNQVASGVQITVKYRNLHGQRQVRSLYGAEGVWVRRSNKHLHANDEQTWLRVVRPLMEAMPDLTGSAEPSYVGIVFSGLLATKDMNLSLFDEDVQERRLAQIVDDLNRRTQGGVHLASLRGLNDVPTRIAFGAPDTP